MPHRSVWVCGCETPNAGFDLTGVRRSQWLLLPSLLKVNGNGEWLPSQPVLPAVGSVNGVRPFLRKLADVKERVIHHAQAGEEDGDL